MGKKKKKENDGTNRKDIIGGKVLGEIAKSPEAWVRNEKVEGSVRV